MIPALKNPHSNRSSQKLLPYHDESGDDDFVTLSKHTPKAEALVRPHGGTSRFKDNTRSRLLRKFPFLIEMFYWIINYAFCRMTAITSEKRFAGHSIWDVVESHGIAILEFE